MEHDISPQSEQYLQQIVESGLYSSKEAAIDAAVAALREKNGAIPFVPGEHQEAVDEGLAESKAGLSRPMHEEDWARLRTLASQVAEASQQGMS